MAGINGGVGVTRISSGEPIYADGEVLETEDEMNFETESGEEMEVEN